MNRDHLKGLYAITSDDLCSDGGRLLAAVEGAVLGGARLIQYRDKNTPYDERLHRARLLTGLCHHLDTLLIINDDPALAVEAGADGVHLGLSDTPIEKARALLGATAIIGASCGPSLERAATAATAGADYLAFGRFFPSKTKPAAPHASPDVLRQARSRFNLPLCAIGGITPANAADLITAGADMVAAVEGVFGSTDSRLAASGYAHLFAER